MSAVVEAGPTPKEYESVENVDSALQLEAKVIARLSHASPLYSVHLSAWTYVIALDVAYDPTSSLTVASAVLWDVLSAKVIDEHVERATAVHFPYTPGLLAFREIPSLYRVAQRLLSHHPSRIHADNTILLCDGNGTLHPRRCGVACHLGLLLSFPSIGVAKNHHVGTLLPGTNSNPAEDPHKLIDSLPPSRGQRVELYVGQIPSGFLLRTQDGVRPVYVSPGFHLAMDQACDIVLTLTSTFRQPDAIRRADHIGRIELQRRI
jgi:deoxyribonuclease V